jgi:hypothetical protein
VPFGAYSVTLQLLASSLPKTSVSEQEGAERLPTVVVQDTLPVGLDFVPIVAVSVTVAVQELALPTTTEGGTHATLVAVLRVTLNVCALDSPPPGAGLKTVIGNVPVVARSPAGIAAVSCVELTKLVVRLEPSKRTTELAMKLVPFTVSVNAPLFCALLVGEMLVVVGTGFATLKVIAVPLNEFPALSVAVA